MIVLFVGSKETWIKEGIRAIWFKIPLSLSIFIPVLADDGFKYHHARDDFASLYKWVCKEESDNVPSYPFTNIGVAGLVIDSEDRVLVIQEKYTIKGMRPWKFPGGTADKGEDIGKTAEREVFEETGIRCKFHSILTMRHMHKYQFGSSDIFITCLMTLDESKPDSHELTKCTQEIHDVAWKSIDELIPHLTEFNRFCLEKYWFTKKTGVALTSEKVPFILGGDVTVYSTTHLEEKKE